MSGSNEWPPWLIALAAAVPSGAVAAGPKLWAAWRAWRGDVSAAHVAAERVELDERAQLATERAAVAARADAAFARSDAEVARAAVRTAELDAKLAAETASGQHWYAVARAWWSRAWDKLAMARGLRDDVIEAREGWADDRRGWFEADPDGARRARRPAWMGAPPEFAVAEPEPIPDPPGLEEILPP